MTISRISALFIMISAAFAGTGCLVEDAAGEDIASAEAFATDERAPGSFELFEGKDGQYYFRLVSGNYETVLRSEGYTRKASAENGMDSVWRNGFELDNYQIREANNGDHYFVLRAGNYQVIGVSEMYATKYNAERGAQGVVDLLHRMADFDAAHAAQ